MIVILFPYLWTYLVFTSSLDLISLLCRHPRAPLSSHLAFAFNIDEEYPIIISNKFNGKDAHFGASVVMLSAGTKIRGQHDHPSNGEHSVTGWVLIGTPKANSTSSNHLKIFEPGLIWRCSVGGHYNVSNGKSICEIVELDPTGDYDPRDPGLPFKDRKDGGWLGGSMFVGQSDKFVTCASRWTNQKWTNHYFMNGICYWVPKSHVMADSDDPNWLRLPPKMSYRLNPLVNKTNFLYKEISTNGSSNFDRTTIYNWAVGQFGFSIHLTPNNELIAGAPGILDWTGSIVYYRDSDAPQPLLKRYNYHPGYTAFSEVLVVSSQTLGHLLHTNDYFGYSVTSGNFFLPAISSNKTQFAAGAPRSSHLSGKVIIFSLEEVNGSRSEGRLHQLVEPIEGHATTKGNHYGSYFGHSLLALDVNGDRFDDLIVSAPLYGTSVRYKRNAAVPTAGTEEHNKGSQKGNATDGDSPQPKMKSGDEGCVFVYLSTGTEFSLTTQELCGEKVSGARFGMALTSLSDINRDGFNDLAVGAPFENEGRGAVYIYHGGRDFLVLAQKLDPKSLDPNIRSFGWALSLGVDVDDNGYPDLAVGAYETNQVIIYRTVPIVHFTTLLTASIPKLLSNTEQFYLTTCITYSGHGSMPSALAIWVKLTVEVEPDAKKLIALVDRTVMGGRLLNNSFLDGKRIDDQQPLMLSYQRRLYFRSDGVGSCYNFTAVRVGSFDGLPRQVTNVSIRQDYWIDSRNSVSGHSKPILYDIIANGKLPKVNLSSTEDLFHTKLPMPAGNAILTERLFLPVGSICEADGDPECLANLTISAWLQDYRSEEIYGSSQPFVLGTTDILALNVELANHRETASLPVTLSLKWLPPPSMRRLPKNCEFSAEKVLLCTIGRPIKENHKEIVTIDLDMLGVYGAPIQENIALNISIDASTSSLLVQPAKHNLNVPLLTFMRPQNFSHKSSKIEYSVGNSSIPTFGLTQAFEIGLNGVTTAAGILVSFDIPVGIFLPENDDDEGDNKEYQLIGVKTPIVTYDGLMTCEIVNGSFLNEEGYMGGVNVTVFDEISSGNAASGDGDHGKSKISDVPGILKRKVRRVRRSVWAGSEEQSDNYDYGGILKIHCDPSAQSILKTKCIRVVCKASHFTPNKKAVTEFRLRIFNKVVTKLLYYENRILRREEFDRIAALWIESVGVVRTLTADGKPFGEIGTLQFTSRLQIPPPYDLPAWILIVSVGGGLLMFTLFTILLKKCGFFRRSKRDELIKRKVEQMQRSLLVNSAMKSPSESSTAKIGTNSSSRRSLKKKRSHLNEVNSNGGTGHFNPIFGSSDDGAAGSILGMELGSPGTAVRQREIPGAVDLDELRRIYDFAYEDQRDNF